MLPMTETTSFARWLVRHPRHRHDETTMRVSEDGEAVQCQVCGSWHWTDPERQDRLDRGEW